MIGMFASMLQKCHGMGLSWMMECRELHKALEIELPILRRKESIVIV
jgi:hypothetical protein